MKIQEAIDKGKEQQLYVLHLGIPLGVFKILNGLATKEKKNLATFLGDILREKAEEIMAKHEPEEG